MLLPNGGFCHGCILYLLLISSPFIRKLLLFRKWQKHYIFYCFHLFFIAVLKQDNFMTHFSEFCKHRFVMQPLQNPTLCSSIQIKWKYSVTCLYSEKTLTCCIYLNVSRIAQRNIPVYSKVQWFSNVATLKCSIWM